MSELIVLAFETETGAQEMLDHLQRLQTRKIITLADAATVVRGQDGKVKVKQAVSLVGTGALGGAFWGLLIGIIFWMPWMGLAVGALTGAVAAGLTDIGIDDGFIQKVGNTIEPGNSALFLLVHEAKIDRLQDELKISDAKVLQTSLSKEDYAKLQATFGLHGDEDFPGWEPPDEETADLDA
jgi:uncharacterized membrane protein